MSKSVSKADSTYRAECMACEWSRERGPEQKGLSPKDHRGIVKDQARNHAYNCPERDGNEPVAVKTGFGGGA